MTARPAGARHLTLDTADGIIQAVTHHTPLGDRHNIWHHLTRHDFAASTGPLELRALPTFGFGGKLTITPTRADRPAYAYASAYPEHLHTDPTANDRLDTLNAALADVTISLEPVVDTAIADRSNTIHRSAGHGDVDFQPIACGQGIVANAGTSPAAITCIPCRILPDHPATTSAYFDLADALTDATTAASFPTNRAPYAQAQIQRAALLASTGDIRPIVAAELSAGVPAGSYPNVRTATYVELVHAFIQRERDITIAHGVRDRSRFPNRRPMIEALDRLDATLTVTG